MVGSLAFMDATQQNCAVSSTWSRWLVQASKAAKGYLG
jgi:hypothetical protein